MDQFSVPADNDRDHQCDIVDPDDDNEDLGPDDDFPMNPAESNDRDGEGLATTPTTTTTATVAGRHRDVCEAAGATGPRQWRRGPSTRDQRRPRGGYGTRRLQRETLQPL
ncbi:MAG: hypothetical protein CM1200mP32_01490 [Methanobacteriota archaeon]|nr:MAG: hypothetical protein CM1200mP32_01490 [Euryarchaeota archaeon]